MIVRINPGKTARLLTRIVVFLTLANIVAQVFKFGFDYDYVLGFYPAFDLNTEGNIPTFYSAIALLMSAVLLAIIAKHKFVQRDEFRYQWVFLAFLFGFLAIDEASQLHEIFVAVLQPKYDLQGVFFFIWVVPYGIFTIVFGTMYLRFLRALPVKTAKLFVLAAIIFLTGAIGFELVASVVVSSLGGWESGFYDLRHVLLYSIEEPLEMIGIVIFIFAILDYLAESQIGSNISVVIK